MSQTNLSYPLADDLYYSTKTIDRQKYKKMKSLSFRTDVVLGDHRDSLCLRTLSPITYESQDSTSVTSGETTNPTPRHQKSMECPKGPVCLWSCLWVLVVSLPLCRSWVNVGMGPREGYLHDNCDGRPRGWNPNGLQD